MRSNNSMLRQSIKNVSEPAFTLGAAGISRRERWGADLGWGVVLGIFEQLVCPDTRSCPLQRVPICVLVKGDMQSVCNVLCHLPQGRMSWSRREHPLAYLQHAQAKIISKQ